MYCFKLHNSLDLSYHHNWATSPKYTLRKKILSHFFPSLSCHVVLKLTAAGYKCPQQLLKMKQKQELQVRFKLASCVSLNPLAVTASLPCQQKYRPCTAANLDHEHWFDLVRLKRGWGRARGIEWMFVQKDEQEMVTACCGVLRFLHNKGGRY